MPQSENLNKIKNTANISFAQTNPNNLPTLDKYYFQIDRIAAGQSNIKFNRKERKQTNAQLKQSLTEIGKLRNSLEEMRQDL